MDTSDECVRSQTITIPWDVIEQYRRGYVEKYLTGIKVPGFRGGTAPYFVICKTFTLEIQQMLQEQIAPILAHDYLRERDLRIAGPPRVDRVRFEEGEPYEIDVSFEVFGDFELGEYRGLEIELPAKVDIDEAADRMIEELRESHASYRNLDPRPVADGDHVLLKFVEAEGRSQEVQMRVGDESYPPELSEALRGRQPGDRFDFMASEARPNPGVELLAVQERELPELDDEFARDAGEQFDSLDQLRHEIRQIAARRIQEGWTNAAHLALQRRLAETHEMVLPKAYMERELQQELANNPPVGPNGEEYLQALRTSLEAQIRAMQVVDRIALVESIVVSEDEISAFAQRFIQLASGNEGRSEVLELSRENVDLAVNSFVIRRTREQALDYVLSEAEVSTLAESESEIGASDEAPSPSAE